MKKKLIGIAVALLVLLVVVVVVAALSLDKAIKHAVELVGPKVTKVEVTLDKATVSLWSGAGSLHGFALGNPVGYTNPSCMQFDSASLALVPRSLISDKIVIRHIRLEAPVITLEGSLRGNNLNDLLENMETAKPKPSETPDTKEEKAASRKLQVDEFTLTGARLRVNIKELGGDTRTFALPDIHLANLGTGPDGITARELTSLLLTEVVKGAWQTFMESGGDLSEMGESFLKQLKESGNTDTEKVVRGVMDLFKKTD